MKNVFTDFRTVLPEEIDGNNHVNNIVYLQWVQDISKKHWCKLTKNNLQTTVIWVVLRHEIDYLLPALSDEKITLKTWVGETFGSKSVRYVHIFKNEKLLVKVKTTWCLLNAKSFRPVKISKEIMQLLQLNT